MSTKLETIDLQKLLSRYFHAGCSTKGSIPLDCGMVVKFKITWSDVQQTHIVEYQIDNAIISVFDSTHIEDCYYIDEQIYSYVKQNAVGNEGNIHRLMQRLFYRKRTAAKAKVKIKFAEVTETHYLFNRHDIFQ